VKYPEILKNDLDQTPNMPEGPEVMIMCDNLRTLLQDKEIIRVITEESFYKRTKGLPKNLEFVELVTVVSVKAKGKVVWISLSNSHHILISFGMTGNIRVDPDNNELALRKQTIKQYIKHNVFTIVARHENVETRVYYNSVRRFGTVHYLNNKDLVDKLSQIGPSILDELMLSNNDILVRWQKPTNICLLLMNQKLISGIGNYIKSEILYSCRVSPHNQGYDLAPDKLIALYQAARSLALSSYKNGGASLYSYTGLHGDRSSFKNELQVYNKKVDPLGNKIEVIKTPDGRTTHWVPSLLT
jgi:DNA-formamidopyrimidine glycosylase